MSTPPPSQTAQPSLPPYLEPLSQGLYAVDTAFQRDRFDAAFLLVDNGRAAFIDTGPNPGVERLLGSLQALGLSPHCVDWVIPTHVHLDHAGACGLLMQHLPQATLLAHPRGARHLIDPSALYQGALAVYGEEEMARSYGELLPVPAERVQTSHDGQRIRVGQRELELIDTPGHARHHHCIWDEHSQGWFTGDTFGLSYREFDVDGRPWILPTTTPVQFDHAALKHSVSRMLARKPQWMYLTHYAAVGDVARLGELLLTQLQDMTEAAFACPPGPARHETLKQAFLGIYARSLREHGCEWSEARIAEWLAIDIELNAQGIVIWADQQRKASSPGHSA
jgi:glyoxylase-like metal-dependent hydrolase (beta-lactamase superfamily II)